MAAAEAAPIVQAVADVANNLDGKTFTIQDSSFPLGRVFELNSVGGVTGTNIPVNFATNANATAVANAISTAVIGAGLNALVVAGTNRVIINGDAVNFTAGTSAAVGIDDLTDVYQGRGMFFQISTASVQQASPGTTLLVEENSTVKPSAQRQIIVNLATSPFTMGADGQRINFAPFTSPVGKVPTVQADTSGVPVWSSQNTTSGVSSLGNIAIPFLAEDSSAISLVPGVVSVGQRIANAVNNAFPSGSIVATAGGGFVRLNKGNFVLPAVTPFSTAARGRAAQSRALRRSTTSCTPSAIGAVCTW